MKADEKKTLLDTIESNGLMYEILNLSRREIIIHEATGHSARMMGEISKQIEADTDLSEGAKDTLYSLYVPLMSCSVGDLPKNFDEFLWMKNEALDEWTAKARAMNPKMFTVLELQEKKLELLLKARAKSSKTANTTTSPTEEDGKTIKKKRKR